MGARDVYDWLDSGPMQPLGAVGDLDGARMAGKILFCKDFARGMGRCVRIGLFDAEGCAKKNK
jgi:hypothetical protein